MATLVASLIFFILLPCFSNSCTTTLPCNHSIQITPPFYFESDSPSCVNQFSVGCKDDSTPFIIWHSKSFPLESIEYGSNIIKIQDPFLDGSLKESSCGNLKFNFSTPVNGFSHKLYDSFNTSLLSLRCEAPDQIHFPPKVFGEDYNLSYSTFLDRDDEYHRNCSRPGHPAPSFEFTLSFEAYSRELSLMSASYSNDLLAQPGCFANTTEVFDCGGCKGQQFPYLIFHPLCHVLSYYSLQLKAVV